MLILQLIETLGPAGAEKALLDYVRLLRSDDVHFVVARLFRGDEGRFHDHDFADLGVPVVDIGMRSRWDLLRGIVRVSRLARQKRVDMIHTHLWTADVVGRMAGGRAGVPVVSTIHQVMPYSDQHGSAPRRLRIWAALIVDRWTSRRTAALVGVSDVVAESARRTLRVGRASVVTIQNPVALTPRATGMSRAEFWASAGIDGSHRFYLLTVGRVSPQKDLLCAVRAVAALRAGGYDAVLVSAGALADHAYVSIIRREIELSAKGAVFMLGPRHDISDLLAHSDLFVFPSIHEGMGIALVEAMVAAVPCVVADLPVLRQVGGDEVVYVPARRPAELATVLRSLLDDPARRRVMGQRAQAAAKVRFDAELSAAQLRVLYENVLEASRNTWTAPKSGHRAGR